MRFKKTNKNVSEKPEKTNKAASKSAKKSAAGMSAKSVIGVEIGPANIRMVQISGKGSGQVQLEKYAIEHLPQNIITSTDIVNFDTLVSHLQQCYDNLKTNCKSVNIALPLGIVTIEENLSYDPSGELSVQEFVETEVARVGALDEMSYDWQVLASNKATKDQTILMVAARTDSVNQYIDLLDGIGVNAINMDVDLFALFNAFAYADQQQGGQFYNERVALFDVGDVSTKALIVESGQILYKHETNFGLDQMIQLIQRNYQVTEGEALEMIQGRRQQPADYKKEVLDYYNVQIAQEVQRVMQFFMTTRSDEVAVRQIFISGGGCIAGSNLAEVVNMNTNIVTQHLAPVTLANNKLKGNGESFGREADSLTTAFGLALRGLFQNESN